MIQTTTGYSQSWKVHLGVREGDSSSLGPGGLYEVIRRYDASGEIGFTVPICALTRRQHAVDIARHLSAQEGIPFYDGTEPVDAQAAGPTDIRALIEAQQKLAAQAAMERALFGTAVQGSPYSSQQLGSPVHQYGSPYHGSGTIG